MEEELLNEFKTQMEAMLRSILTEKMNKSQNLSYSLKRLAILNTAATFGQNIKGSYSDFKSRFESIIRHDAITQVKYNLIIDTLINTVLEEFIDTPKEYDKYYDNDIFD
jgi:hypothetical protein